MKCVCGYEQKEDFGLYYEDIKTTCFDVKAQPTITIGKRVYQGLHVCPKCGTLKMKVMGDNEI